MPLHIAAENGNAELCTLFILHRANINQADSDDETPLYRAVKKEQIPICKLLVKSGANINFGNSEGTILLMAISTTNEELVEYLLSQGAEVDGIPPSDHDRMPLAYAARNNHSGMVKLLLDRGAPIDRTDKKNRTALWDACDGGSLSAAKLLLERGANPNVADIDGVSIIETATCSGNVEIVKLLIQHDVTLFSQRNEGFLALKIAIENGFVSIAHILLAATPAHCPTRKSASHSTRLPMQNSIP
jgi:ankyrin